MPNTWINQLEVSGPTAEVRRFQILAARADDSRMRTSNGSMNGIANVKWLQHIEVLPTRYENRFMARDYVTIREQQIDGQSVWTETSVGRALQKSARQSHAEWRPVSDRGRRVRVRQSPRWRCRSAMDRGCQPRSTRARDT
jgi:hypothetical protein